MSKIRVPDRFRNGLAKLATVSDEAVDALFRTLSGGDTSEAAVNRRLIEASLQGELLISESEAREIVAALRSIYHLWSGLDITAAELVSEISDALIDDQVMKGSPVEDAKFSERLSRLLTIKRLKAEAKARDLQTEDERLFCRGRILTDLRPVFGDDPSDAPASFLVLHHLKIVYHEASSKHREFIVTLDDDDLASLKAAIERAETKARALTDFLGNPGTRG